MRADELLRLWFAAEELRSRGRRYVTRANTVERRALEELKDSSQTSRRVPLSGRTSPEFEDDETALRPAIEERQCD